MEEEEEEEKEAEEEEEEDEQDCRMHDEAMKEMWEMSGRRRIK